jgi:hypothetical protein
MIYLKTPFTSKPWHHDIPQDQLQGLLVEVILRYIMVSRFTGGGYLEVYQCQGLLVEAAPPVNFDSRIYLKITSTSKP